jgi:hypothetical protein
MGKKRSHYRYTKENLEPIVIGSTSYAQVIQKLGLKQTGGTQTHMKNLVAEFGISTEHFTGSGHMKGKHSLNRHTRESFERIILVKGRIENGTRLRKNLIRFGYKENRCEKCKGETWLGKPIPLEVHHRDEDHSNNEIDNLELVCPNCHALYGEPKKRTANI